MLPKIAEAPEPPIIALNVKPPPKRNNTPQSVFSETSCHEASPRITTDTAQAIATNVSGEVMPKWVFNCPPKIHASAVTTKRIVAKTRGNVQGITSSVTLMRILSFGLKII